MDDGQHIQDVHFTQHLRILCRRRAEARAGSWELGLITRSGAESLDTSKRSENRSALLQKRWQCMSWELVSLRNKKAEYRVFIQVFLSVFPNIPVAT